MRTWIAGAVLGTCIGLSLIGPSALAASESTLYDVGYHEHSIKVDEYYAPPGAVIQVGLNYREWYSPNATDVLVYVSGMQSHSQWFNDAADEFAARGFNVYALDRRGSGLSHGKRGHVRTPFQWVADLAQFIGFVKAKNPGKRVHLMGNSFGARIVMTYAESFPTTIDTLILETPATAMRVSLTPQTMVEIQSYVWKYYPTPLHDELFTDQVNYLDFMAQDDLAIRNITANIYKMGELINVGNLMARGLAQLTMPVLMLVSNDDPIVDTPAVVATIYDRLNTSKKLVRYDGVRHFLLFEPVHAQVIEEISAWMNGATTTSAAKRAAAAVAPSDAVEEDGSDWILSLRTEAEQMGWSPLLNQ
ncbi:MAG: alpha/beta fold hydrolase [Rhodospirillales bacterium]|nr:alpha/beta fold hydrolase [Rhodospirillales bacterium]